MFWYSKLKLSYCGGKNSLNLVRMLLGICSDLPQREGGSVTVLHLLSCLVWSDSGFEINRKTYIDFAGFCQIICSLSVSLLGYPHSTFRNWVKKLDLLLVFKSRRKTSWFQIFKPLEKPHWSRNFRLRNGITFFSLTFFVFILKSCGRQGG